MPRRRFINPTVDRYRRTKTRADRARVRTNRKTSQMECEILGCRGGTIDCRGGARCYRLAMMSEPLECMKLAADPLAGISTSVKKKIVNSYFVIGWLKSDKLISVFMTEIFLSFLAWMARTLANKFTWDCLIDEPSSPQLARSSY